MIYRRQTHIVEGLAWFARKSSTSEGRWCSLMISSVFCWSLLEKEVAFCDSGPVVEAGNSKGSDA